MPIQIIDASAMIAFLRGEPGAEVSLQLLADPTNDCYAHAVHFCEVYRWFLGHGNVASAEAAVADLVNSNITTRYDMDEAFRRDVATWIHSIRRAGRTISLADSFGIALTRRLAATFNTSDHHEFDYVAAQGICAVNFIR